jgi:hypothetical protein
MGQCSAARTPPRAVRPSRSRDQEAAPSNRRESLIPVPVTSQWCAQEASDQAARTPWPPGLATATAAQPEVACVRPSIVPFLYSKRTAAARSPGSCFEKRTFCRHYGSIRLYQPWTYPVELEDTRIRVTTDICFLRYCRLLTLYFGDGHVLLPRRRSDDGASGTRPGRHPLCLSLGR